MKNKECIVAEYLRDFNEVVIPEEIILESAPVKPETLQPSTIKKQLDELRKHINYIGMFVGIPQITPIDNILSLYPARITGEKRASPKAVSYIVDLSPYRKTFSTVRFKAMTPFGEEKDIVRGIVVDVNGNVESATGNRYEKSNPWTRLPITENSSCLVATVPLENGEPAWIPDRVEFLPLGLAQVIAELAEGVARETVKMNNTLAPLQEHLN